VRGPELRRDRHPLADADHADPDHADPDADHQPDADPDTDHHPGLHHVGGRYGVQGG
jgi:hypothetical protein